MKFLLDIPFIVALAEWVWTVEMTEEDEGAPVVLPKTSAELCLSTLPLMNGDCWSQLIVKGLGIAIILGACLNKAPIIRNILANQAAAGLSRASIYGETLMYANSAAYGQLLGHPFSAYGENACLLLQSLIIIVLAWKFADPKVSLREQGLIMAAGAAYLATVTMFLPESQYYLLMTSIMPILLYSRGSQILQTYQCQHTGAQSIITTTMNLVGGLIRILTTIKEVGWDPNVLGMFGLSLGLNIVCFLQFFYYKENTNKFVQDLQAAAKKKQQ